MRVGGYQNMQAKHRTGYPPRQLPWARKKGTTVKTWLDDIKDPKVRKAYEIVGSQDSTSLSNMIRALSMFGGYLNSPEDNERLAAAKVVRAYRKTRK